MALISVIVPVYNTGKYLSQCLDSILTQTFTDFEVICINDGSTDNSDKILADYAKRDKRIHVITQKNSGVVVARNNGIAQARGIYIYIRWMATTLLHQIVWKNYTQLLQQQNIEL